LVLCPVEQLVEHLELYVRSNGATFSEFVQAWEKLQPYTVTVPLECSPLTGQFFALNVRTALAILQCRQSRAHPPGPRSASPHQ
jgi:hypothetical protein